MRREVDFAANEKLIREHAERGGFPANRVSEVKEVIDPVTSETRIRKSGAVPASV
jgi:hypothetical protein